MGSGGGIAGLTFAAFIAERPDIEVHVFENKPEIRAIGSGIAMWKRFWDIIENYVDFEQHCTLRGLRVRSWSEGKSNPPLVFGFSLYSSH